MFGGLSSKYPEKEKENSLYKPSKREIYIKQADP